MFPSTGVLFSSDRTKQNSFISDNNDRLFATAETSVDFHSKFNCVIEFNISYDFLYKIGSGKVIRFVMEDIFPLSFTFQIQLSNGKLL